jgi:hypothetical protein
MNEDELELRLNGKEILLTRYNTTLFTHFGRVLLRGLELDAKNFDHVFIRTSDEDDENLRGARVWRGLDAYKPIAKFCIQHKFPIVGNSTDVGESDVAAWELMNFADVDFGVVPPDWTIESSE